MRIFSAATQTKKRLCPSKAQLANATVPTWTALATPSCNKARCIHKKPDGFRNLSKASDIAQKWDRHFPQRQSSPSQQTKEKSHKRKTYLPADFSKAFIIKLVVHNRFRHWLRKMQTAILWLCRNSRIRLNKRHNLQIWATECLWWRNAWSAKNVINYNKNWP